MRVQNVNTKLIQEGSRRLDSPYRYKFPKLTQWIEGIAYPTFNQLRDFAKATHIPFGYFFLEEFPPQEASIPHFRTTKRQSYQPSQDLSQSIELVEERQAWARDLLLELGGEPLPFAGKSSVQDSVEASSKKLSEILNLSGPWASSLTRWTDSLKLLIERAEAAGIFVIVNGIVNNNTHRSLQVQEFRGFVLYDEIAPFVFINGKDSISGKIFTLIHEIVHVLVGASASFDLQHLQAADDKVEQFCDQVAAEFLLPRTQLLKEMDQIGDTKIDYQQLARQFKVSQIVIARRLLDLSVIERDTYFSFYNNYIQTEHNKSPKGKGGDFYNTVPYRLSKRFFDLIDSAVRQDRMLYRDAFRLTGLKAHTYDQYLKRLDS